MKLPFSLPLLALTAFTLLPVQAEPAKAEHIHFEALLVKQADGWKILMENQKGPAQSGAE